MDEERKSERGEMKSLPDLVTKFFQGLPESAWKQRNSDSNGVGADRVPPQPTICDFCGAERWPLAFEVAPGEMRYAPAAQPCTCEGYEASLAQIERDRIEKERVSTVTMMLKDADLLRGKWARMTLDAWDAGRNLPSSQAALSAAMAFIDEVRREGRNWLFIYGPYGTGKTHLAVAIMRKLVDVCLWRPRVVVWPEHCSAVQQSWRSDSGPTERDLWDRMRDAAILLIDDLDKRAPTSWAMGKLYEVIEYRYREEKPTVFTANKAITDLASVWANVWLGSARDWEAQQIRDAGAAVLSRIVGQAWGCIEMAGEDQRW